MISRKTDNFTGFIIQDKEKICFHAENRIFNFMSEGVGIFNLFGQRELKAPDMFLHGYTTDGYQLALYTGWKSNSVSANYKLRPGIYLISTANMHCYDMSAFQAIEFRGGTLNNLYEKRHISNEYDSEKQCYIRTYPEIKREYQIKIREYECKLIIKSVPSNGNLAAMDLVMRYEFSEKVPIATIKLVYNVLIDICRFMTNRKNVGMNEMSLFQIDEESGKWLRFAEGFIDYQYSNFTEKSFTKNILFDYMQDCIVNLHSVVSENTEGESTYLFDFYADDDKDVNRLTNDKIKNICSTIECELDFAEGLKDDENENLKALIADIKKVIKAHRKSEKKLEDKTYDMIGASMSHWGMANSRKIYLLYMQKSKYMKVLEEKFKLSCSEEDIATYVKYRNDITHGRYRTLDPVIAKTAYTLMALSYCCFLERIGMKEDDLMYLLESGKISS